MTGIVLALTGLASGDCEPGMRAAREPVRLRLDTSCWVGTWQHHERYGHRTTTHRVELRWGREWTQSVVGEDYHGWFVIGTTAEGSVLFSCRKEVVRGIYQLKGGTVIVATGHAGEGPPKSLRLTRHTSILTLHPAPPKPKPARRGFDPAADTYSRKWGQA
jgi:hypothetical protein